jgi:hypothetical protein
VLATLQRRADDAERRCTQLEARIASLERERRELRERLEALVGLLEGIERD